MINFSAWRLRQVRYGLKGSVGSNGEKYFPPRFTDIPKWNGSHNGHDKRHNPFKEEVIYQANSIDPSSLKK